MQTVPPCVHTGTTIIALRNLSSARDPRRRHSLQARAFPSRRCAEAEGQAWIQKSTVHTRELDGGTSRTDHLQSSPPAPANWAITCPDHSLDQALSSSGLQVRLSPLQTGPLARR